MVGDGGDMELIDRGFLLGRLIAPVGWSVAQMFDLRMTFGHRLWRSVEEKIFGKFSFGFWNRAEALDALGVDDGEIQTRFGAVIEENRVHYFARAGRQAEGNIGNSKNCADVGNLFLDQANAFDGFERAADVVLVAGAARKNQRVEDNIFDAEFRIVR